MRRWIMVFVGLLIVVIALFVFVFLFFDTSRDLFIFISILNAFVIVTVAAFVILRIRKDMKSGIPIKDEMSKRMTYRAGYYSWVATVFIVIAIMVINIIGREIFSYKMDSGILIPFIIIVPGLLFIGLRTFHMKKGLY